MSFQILSMSGGGFLGLYSAAVLASLEVRIDRPIAGCFNLLSGTSIGGITALALANEVPARRVLDVFNSNGKLIFGKRPPPQSAFGVFLDLCRGALSSKYSADALRAAISDIIGSDTRIGDLKHPVLIPAVNLSKGAPQIFKTPHHPDFRIDLDRKVVEVALATSAAPTFFPLAEVDGALFTDGGLFANSPDILALHEAMYFLKHPEKDIRLLSIGTTTAQFSFAHRKNNALGISQWFKDSRFLSVMIASQQKSVDYMMQHRLGEGYLRLDEIQSKEQEKVLGLDVATNEAKKTVQALAEATIQRFSPHPQLKIMLSQNAPSPVFYRDGKLINTEL